MKLKLLNRSFFATVISLLLFTAFTTVQQEVNSKYSDVIKFDHQLHVEASECADCHTGVLENTVLSRDLLPVKETCAGCHDVDDDENCTMCHYEDKYDAFEYQGSEIYFNHQQHLDADEPDCYGCHVVFENKEITAVKNPVMENCSGCHNDRSVASFECSACHKSSDNLVPANHSNIDFERSHSVYQTTDGNCAMCHNEDFCGSCHEATKINLAGGASELIPLLSPHKFMDNTKNQKISRVHDLDFRMTHGIEAKGKVSECSTCHVTEAFCTECHSVGGGEINTGIVPSSHLVTNFTTMGVGTGGGAHADEARRDIESCAVCHDTHGADPGCILCHTDNDGVKGTNPKTHNSSITDLYGDWHDDRGSVCYNCHTDVSASPNGSAGVGFCGYCHGSK